MHTHTYIPANSTSFCVSAENSENRRVYAKGNMCYVLCIVYTEPVQYVSYVCMHRYVNPFCSISNNLPYTVNLFTFTPLSPETQGLCISNIQHTRYKIQVYDCTCIIYTVGTLCIVYSVHCISYLFYSIFFKPFYFLPIFSLLTLCFALHLFAQHNFPLDSLSFACDLRLETS